MIILSCDPGRVSGMAVLNTDNGKFEVHQVDARGESKESAGAMVTDKLDELFQHYVDAIVLEDFVLRPGQAVDIVPEYLLGVIDGYTEFETIKYSPSSHKSGNKAYNISKLLKNVGITLNGDHKTDAMSLALHHWKIIDLPAALKVLQEIKK